MIEAADFYTELVAHNTDFFTGVPDSLLKSFCAYLSGTVKPDKHSIAVNEGAALALACGYHLATGKIPLVYMQNSGIGNAVNPLLSLADSAVYRIPVVLLIGWRGEPGVHDEPQHITQGRLTLPLLDTMEIPYAVLSNELAEAQKQIRQCYQHIQKTNAAFAFVVKKDTFAPYTQTPPVAAVEGAVLPRERAIEVIVRAADERGVFIATTGMASRELYEIRRRSGGAGERDFLTVGSMGHASQIALGIALQRPELPVTVLDGDGAVLMHLGALAAIGAHKPRNLCHIVLNNGAHDSVGGQPTIAPLVDLCGIARAAGYPNVYRACTEEALQNAVKVARGGLTFIEAPVLKGARADLGRPKTSPEDNKRLFMHYIQNICTKENIHD